MKCGKGAAGVILSAPFFRCFIENVCTEQKEREELLMMETISMGLVAHHSPVRNPYLYDHPYRFYSEKDDIKRN